MHQIFPDAEVKVKPMQANGLNSDASKSDREKLNRMLEEMFEESDMWLVSEFPTVRGLACRDCSGNLSPPIIAYDERRFHQLHGCNASTCFFKSSI